MASPRMPFLEGGRHDQGNSTFLSLPKLSAASLQCGGSCTSTYQSATCHARRTRPPARHRLLGRPARPWSHPSPGTNHRTQSQYHPPWYTRLWPATAGRPRADSTKRRWTPACRKKGEDILAALEHLLQDAVAGDPVTGLKWTHKSTRRLSAALRRLGFQASPNTV